MFLGCRVHRESHVFPASLETQVNHSFLEVLVGLEFLVAQLDLVLRVALQGIGLRHYHRRDSSCCGKQVL